MKIGKGLRERAIARGRKPQKTPAPEAEGEKEEKRSPEKTEVKEGEDQQPPVVTYLHLNLRSHLGRGPQRLEDRHLGDFILLPSTTPFGRGTDLGPRAKESSGENERRISASLVQTLSVKPKGN